MSATFSQNEVAIVDLSTATTEQLERLLERNVWMADSVMDTCRSIIQNVRERGDEAVRTFTLEFDGVDLGKDDLRVPQDRIATAGHKLDAQLRMAIDRAIENVRRFHETQLERSTQLVEVRAGVWCGQRVSPIDSVCLYVPRGRGAFASVAYMLAVPAMLADVPNVVICTPPGPAGEVDAGTLYVADKLGIDTIYRVGGAQAVAAVAFGTETIPRCEKIVGPGNVFVSAARQLLSQVLDPGPPAGPSESLIICDTTVNPRNVAWNLMIEAEHGENSTALVVTDSSAMARVIAAEVAELRKTLTPARRAYVDEVLANRGGILVTSGLDESIEFANRFAAEHVALMVRDPWSVLPRVRNAGEVLLGDYPIFSLANYGMGINAILPTGGGARTSSGVTVGDFLKTTSIGFVDREGFEQLRQIVPPISRDEGFSAHHLAVERWEAPKAVSTMMPERS